MSLPPGFLDELRGRLSLAAVVGRKLTWDSRKSNPGRGDWWAPCPFHQEKTASFHVDAKGFYYCFGCHAKGDAIDFLRESESMGFLEAVETLAREAGLALPERSREARAETDRRGRLHAALDAAAGFYRLSLAAGRGAAARAYLDRRGVAPAIRERFGLGFAPDGWTALAEHLAGKGFTPEEIAAAGLTRAARTGRPIDTFRNRLIFPISDAAGRVIAFGGRALDPGEDAKYINSPETPLFDKGRTLFNFRDARAAAGRAGRLLVVEGYMDAIALVEAGIEPVVAPLGTAITEAQLELLWRVAPEPLVALDGDEAGLRAAQRLVDLALPLLVSGRSLRFVLLPPGQDPDTLVRSGGVSAMEALIAASVPIVELIWRRETEGRTLDSPERRAALDARLRAHLARITDEGLRGHYRAEFRNRRTSLLPVPRTRAAAPLRPAAGARYAGRRSFPGIVPRPVAASAAAKASPLGAGPAGAPDTEALLAARVRESAILLGVLNHPALANRFEDRLDRLAFVCPDLSEIRDALLSCLGESLHPGTMDNVGPSAAPLSALCDAVTRRLGGDDPRRRLEAVGQVRANPHLAAGADPRRAALAIEEELARHSAWSAGVAEARDAAASICAEGVDESVTWRLREAADARYRAAIDPIAAENEIAAEPAGESYASRLLAEEAYKRPRRR